MLRRCSNSVEWVCTERCLKKNIAFFCSCNVAVFCNLFLLPLWLDLQLENRSPNSCHDSLLLCTCSLESKTALLSNWRWKWGLCSPPELNVCPCRRLRWCSSLCLSSTLRSSPCCWELYLKLSRTEPRNCSTVT